MISETIKSIRDFVGTQGKLPAYAPAEEQVIPQVERDLGFPLPELLRHCYLEIGNGGNGPGYGVIGVKGGYASDYGDLVETYHVSKQDQELLDLEWPNTMLPFSECGCNIYSRVDCSSADQRVYTFQDSSLTAQAYSIAKFFDHWIHGISILDYQSDGMVETVIVNPFNNDKARISKRQKRGT